MLSARHHSPGRLLAALLAAIVLPACGNAQTSAIHATHPSPTASTSPYPPARALAASTQSRDPLLVPPPLIDPGLDLRAGPVNVPLELRIPQLRVTAPVLGVGLTSKNVMDAPMASANDPVWQKAFWYRGGGTPGSASTATIAGHVDDVLGRPALFANLKDVHPGDPIVVRDTRSGVDLQFVVTETVTYTLKQTTEPAVLARIYGPGPAAGQGPQLSADGLSHLTLITCAGNWINLTRTFDHRLAVYAVSIPLQLMDAVDSRHQRS
jgi:sortase family protein